MQNQFQHPLQQDAFDPNEISKGCPTLKPKADKIRLSQTKIELNLLKNHKKLVEKLLTAQNISAANTRLILELYDIKIDKDNILIFYPYPIFEFTQHLCNGTLTQLPGTSAVQINKISLVNKHKED